MATTRARKTATSSDVSADDTSESPAPPAADKPLTDAEWAVRRAELLAALPAEEDRPKNIYGRLAQITKFIHQIPKTGWNAFHSYAFAREGDIVEGIRPILAEYGIWFEQGLYWGFAFPQSIPDNVDLTTLPSVPILGEERRNQVMKRRGEVTGEAETLTVITLQTSFVWWNPDSGEIERTEPKLWRGYGDDAGDKGIYKAYTGAEKYALMKQFLVATGDDPEGDTGTDKRAAAAEAASNVTVERGARQGARQSAPKAAPGGRQTETSTPQNTILIQLLRAELGADATKAAVAIPFLQSLDIPVKPEVAEGGDAAAALVAWTKDPEAVGKAIAELRKRAQSKTEEPASSEPEEPADGWHPEGPAADGAIDDEAV